MPRLPRAADAVHDQCRPGIGHLADRDLDQRWTTPLERGIQFRKGFGSAAFFRVAGGMNFVRVRAGGKGYEFLLQRICVQPRASRFVEQGEVVRHLDYRPLRAEALTAGTRRRCVGIFHLDRKSVV